VQLLVVGFNSFCVLASNSKYGVELYVESKSLSFLRIITKSLPVLTISVTGIQDLCSLLLWLLLSKTIMSKRCHREDDDDEGGGPRLPTIAESMGDVPVSVISKRSPKFLAYALYDDNKARPIQWAHTWNQPPDPLENLVCLNGNYAAKLARALAVSKRNCLKLLKFKLGVLSMAGAEALGQAIGSRPNLHDLTIKLISKQQKLRVMATLMSGIAQSPSIKTVRLESTCAKANFKPIVSLIRSLETLTIEGDCHVPSLCEGLRLARSLMRLEITRQMLCLDQMQLLSSTLPHCLSIQSLNLSRTEMDDERLMALLDNWQATSPLQELDISFNHITTVGAARLFRACVNLPLLKSLQMKHNQQINFAGIHMIARKIPNVSLKTLDISGCFYYGPSSGEFDLRRAVDALTDAVQSSHTLGQLYFSYGNDKMWFYLELNRLGRFLFTINHGLASTVWCHIFEKCGRSKNTPPANLLYYFLREQPHLVHAAPLVPSSRKRPLSAIM
jgi:hypothetical protein